MICCRQLHNHTLDDNIASKIKSLQFASAVNCTSITLQVHHRTDNIASKIKSLQFESGVNFTSITLRLPSTA